MADNQGVPKEFSDAFGAVCDMVTIVDLETMRSSGKGIQFLTNICEHGGNTLAAYDMVLKYSEDDEGFKHIVAESAGKVVSDVVFEGSMKKAMEQAAAAGLIVAMGDSPAPGPADIAGATVFLGMSAKGYVAAKAKSYLSGKFTETAILKVWPKKNVVKKSIEGEVKVYEHNPDTNTSIVRGNDDVKANLIPTILVKEEPETLIINDHTTKVVHPSTSLQLRNALNAIDDYQFLLSTVIIKPGERLDMGDAGIITVKDGDTLSELAVKYLGGSAVDATRQAVLRNPWLADEGRVGRSQVNNIGYRRKEAA